jgi:hypothetical protein
MLPCQGRDTGPTPVTRSTLRQGFEWRAICKKVTLHEAKAWIKEKQPIGCFSILAADYRSKVNDD